MKYYYLWKSEVVNMERLMKSYLFLFYFNMKGVKDNIWKFRVFLNVLY